MHRKAILPQLLLSDWYFGFPDTKNHILYHYHQLWWHLHIRRSNAFEHEHRQRSIYCIRSCVARRLQVAMVPWSFFYFLIINTVSLLEFSSKDICSGDIVAITLVVHGVWKMENGGEHLSYSISIWYFTVWIPLMIFLPLCLLCGYFSHLENLCCCTLVWNSSSNEWCIHVLQNLVQSMHICSFGWLHCQNIVGWHQQFCCC